VTICRWCNAPLTNGDKALTKTLYRFKIKPFSEDTGKIVEDKLQKKKGRNMTSKDLGNMQHRLKAGDWENVTIVDEMVGLLNHKG